MKTILITGGASGIGAAAVRKFFNEGWNVVFIDNDAPLASELIKELGNPDRVLFLQADTRCRDRIVDAADSAAQAFGHIDSVFANAGIHQSNTILTVSDEELHRIIDINIYGTVNTLRAVVPHIIKAGGGTVVINASDQWFVGKPHSFAYGLTKGALGQITRSLSIDLAEYGIRVNAVCAGTIHTPMVDKIFDRAASASGRSIEELWQEENQLFARGKVGTPAEVAELVYFLASDASSFCTGAHFLADGGLVAG